MVISNMRLLAILTVLGASIVSTSAQSQAGNVQFDFNGVKIGESLLNVKSRPIFSCNDFNGRASICVPVKETTDDFWYAFMGTSMNPYDAQLRFLDGRLIHINVRPLNGKKLVSELRQKYGKPVDTKTEDVQGYGQWHSDVDNAEMFVSYSYIYADNIFNIYVSQKDKEFVSVVGRENLLSWLKAKKEERASVANARKFEIRELRLDMPRNQVPIQNKSGKWTCTNRVADGAELCHLDLAPRTCWDEQVVSPRTGQYVFNALGQPMVVQKCERKVPPKESLSEFDRKFLTLYGATVSDVSVTFSNGQLSEIELTLPSYSQGLKNLYFQKYGEPIAFGATGATWSGKSEKLIIDKEKIILKKVLN